MNWASSTLIGLTRTTTRILATTGSLMPIVLQTLKNSGLQDGAADILVPDGSVLSIILKWNHPVIRTMVIQRIIKLTWVPLSILPAS